AELDGMPTPGAQRLRIPLDDTMCYMTLRRGYEIDLLPNVTYTEAVCTWPHPTHDYMVFRMTLPHASDMERRHPEFATVGLSGLWRLEKRDGTLVLDLVRKLEVPEFWTLVRQ